MKKLITPTILILILIIGCNANKVRDKDYKTQLKIAKKEARKLNRDGWYVAPGDLPLEKQLEQSYIKQLEEDENGFPQYLIASGNSLAGTQSAAKLQATELGKLEIAGAMQSKLAVNIENQIANNQLNQEEAATIQKTVAASKNVFATKMGRTLNLVEIYRKVPKTKNIECQVTLAYSTEMAKQAAMESIKEELQDEADVAMQQLNSIIDF